MRSTRISLFLALSLFSTLAVAGLKVNYPISIGPGQAAGSLSTARASGNTKEYIACMVSATSIVCTALDANGTFAYCSGDPKTQPDLAANARSVNSASYLLFQWDATGACTNIEVINGSYLLP